MKKEWFLKVLFVCGFICAGLFLFTMHSSAQFSYNPYGYQQPYTPYGPSPYDPYRNPYLEDGYSPPPNFSNYNWTDPWTGYDPSGGGAVHVMWQPGYIGTSPYFQQIGYNPYNLNMPYNYGWSQPYFGYQQPYNPYGYQQPPYGYQQFYNPYGLSNDFGGYPPAGNQPSYNPNNPYVYPYADQAPYGYQPPLSPYGYYQGGSLANDMVGPYGYPGFSNPYAMYGDTRYFQ